MSYIRTNDENPYIKFMLQHQVELVVFLKALADIGNQWVKDQIDIFFRDLNKSSR